MTAWKPHRGPSNRGRKAWQEAKRDTTHHGKGDPFSYWDGHIKLSTGSSETSQTRYISEYNRWVNRHHYGCSLPEANENEHKPRPVNIFDGDGKFVRTIVDWRKEHATLSTQESQEAKLPGTSNLDPRRNGGSQKSAADRRSLQILGARRVLASKNGPQYARE